MTDQRTEATGAVAARVRRHSVPKSPPAPGAARSPQMPGEVPDRLTVPGHSRLRAPRPSRPVRRPLTEYGTAQQIMRVFPAPEEEASSTAFEQATASFEELRKAYPWQLPPPGPRPGFSLSQGVSLTPPSLPAGPVIPELGPGELA